MAGTDSSSVAREQRVDAAIADWLQAVEAGTAPERAEFLAQHAEIAAELASFLDDQALFDRAAGAARPRDTAENESVEQPRAAPTRLGDFDLIRPIGRGGMAVVYEAVQRSLGRRVAVKLLLQAVPDGKVIERFRREAAAAARLHHPHVIPIHATGEEAGIPYYAMDLVDGPSFDAELRQLSSPERGRSAWQRLARELANVADALRAAHEQGVIHRDIKPSNLLRAADGRLLVGDFGLARLAVAPELTQTGECLGSPCYMSPEQVSPAGRSIDERTDVYSLGATLYQAIALRPPFTGDSREQVLARVLHEAPTPPRRIALDCPIELETICLRCLEKEPGGRYPTAAALTDDLRRFAAGEPIAARRAGPAERLARWTVRRPIVPVTTLLIAAALSGAVFFAREAQRSQAALQAAQLQDALDDALVAALGADQDAAQQAIGEAEARGASPARLAMLRGQTAYFSGKYDEAARQLEQAVHLAPREMATQSMFAAACVAAGRWEEYESALTTVEHLAAVTPEDRLFRGMAESYLDPDLALRSLDEAVQLRNSPIARLIRAEIRTSLAQDTGDLQNAAEAVDDADFAREMLPDHVGALLASFDAHFVASQIYGRADEFEQQQAALAAADADAVALEAYSDLPLVVVKLALYRQAIGRENESLAGLAAAEERRPGEPVLAYNLALALYRAGQSADALAALDRCQNLTGNSQWLRMWLMLEQEPKAEALAEYARLRQGDASGLEVLFRPCLLLLAGDREAAVAESQEFRGQPGVVPRFRARFYRGLLAFNCGETTADDLLESAGESLWDQSEARFFIGLDRLAMGDRSGALVHLRACVALGCVSTQAWDWSAAIVSRLEANPAWPTWMVVSPVVSPR